MGDFDGENGLGLWHLEVEDLLADTLSGTLNVWRLIFDTETLCHPWTCEEPAPGPVGNSLRMSRIAGEDVRLEWDAVSGAVAA